MAASEDFNPVAPCNLLNVVTIKRFTCDGSRSYRAFYEDLHKEAKSLIIRPGLCLGLSHTMFMMFVKKRLTQLKCKNFINLGQKTHLGDIIYLGDS